MILHTIEIEQFGGLKQYKLELTPGFCYLYGVNEAGKSTLCAFLSAMFYGLPAKQRGAGLKGDSRKLYMPWHERRMGGSVTFTAEGQRFVLKRSFGTTARSDSCTLYAADTWQEIDIADDEIGVRFLGMGSDAFQKTLFISQLGAAFSKGREDELMTRLTNLENTGEEDASVEKALAVLEIAAHELVTKTGRGGAIAQLDMKIEQLKTESLEATQRSEGLESLLSDINAWRREATTLEATIAQTEEQKERAVAFDAYCERRKQREQRTREEQRLQTQQLAQQEAEQKLETLKQQLLPLQAVQDFSQETVVELAEKEAEKQQLIAKQKERDELMAACGDLRQQQAALKAQAEQIVPWGIWPAVIGWVLLSVVCGFLLTPLCYLLLLPAVFAVGFAGGVLLRRKRQNKLELNRLAIELTEKGKMLTAFETIQIESRLEQLSELIDSVYQAAGVESLSELSAKINEQQQLIYQLELATEALEKCRESVCQLTQQLAAEQLPSYETSYEPEQSYDGQTASQLEVSLAELRRRQIDTERRLAQQKALFEHNTDASRSYAVIQSELEAACAERAELAERYESIMLAHAALTVCAEELTSNFAPLLNRRLSETIENLTDGRYLAAKITDEYTMKLQMSEGTDIIDAEYVSAGTYELFYFALRMAVLHTITETIPLLILDDAFVQLDETRRQTAFQLLFEEPAEQILYFSCHRPPESIHTVIHL